MQTKAKGTVSAYNLQWQYNIATVNRKAKQAGGHVYITSTCDYASRRNARIGMERAARRLGIQLV